MDICREFGEPLAWDEVGLTIAKAVAAGETVVYVDIEAGDSPDVAVGILAGWQDTIPNVRLKLRSGAAEEAGARMRRREAEHHFRLGRELLETGGSQSLHEAVRAYVRSLKTNPKYLVIKDRLTDWGKVKVDLAEFLIDHLPDIRLCHLDMERIDQCLDVIAARPNKKATNGKPTTIPISRVYAKTAVKEFRCLIKWLHRAKDWHWEKPRDYEVRPVTIRKDTTKTGAVRVKTYDRDELKLLWAYATPWERTLIALALNCGFGMAEASSLKKDEVLLRQQHPHAQELGLDSDDQDSWVRRHRGKTTVYAEWRLWPVTVRAIGWLGSHRPKSIVPNVVVTKQGNALKVEGQRNSQIANAWKRLFDRIQKDHENFRRLSFNKLGRPAPTRSARSSEKSSANCI